MPATSPTAARLLSLALATLFLVACQAQDLFPPVHHEEPPVEPQFASISGVVRDATTLAPIAGALVKVGEFHTFSRQDGGFDLTGRCDIAVAFTVSHDSYQSLNTVAKFDPGHNTRGIHLTPM